MKLKELLSDALPIISKFAPSIAGAIGGPVGVAAGYFIPILADAFGVHPSDIAGLTQKILNDSDAQRKLEQVESDHCDCANKLSNAEINIKLEWQNQDQK